MLFLPRWTLLVFLVLVACSVIASASTPPPDRPPGLAPANEALGPNLAALDNRHFDDAELARIDQHAVDAGINLWARSGEA